VILRRALGAATLVVVVVGLVLMGSAAPASAHAGMVVATNYQARINDQAGLEVRVVEAGGRVELTNRSSRELTVLGYEGEPYLRVSRNGVFENRNSPATYLNATRGGGQQPPPSATADARPLWTRIGDGPTVRWHDHRLHWMNTAPPAVRDDPHQRHRVAQWQIPVRDGDRTAMIVGDIVYVPGPTVWPWLLAAAVAAAAVVLAARRFGARRALLVAVLGLVAADVVRVAGLSLVVVGTPGDRFRQLADVGTVDLVGWGLGLAAVVRLWGHRSDGRIAAGFAAIVLAVVGGVLEWSDLGRSQLASATPAAVARVCVVAVAGLGLGVAAAVLLDAYRPRRATRPRVR
jgi:hypothetical protein